MSVIDWGVVQYNANTKQVKQMEQEIRHNRTVTDKECFDACMSNLKHPIMLSIRKMIEGFIADDDGTPFSIGRAISTFQVDDWYGVHGKEYNWDNNGNALVGHCIKEQYPTAKMRLNLCPKGYQMLLDAYPDSFKSWRDDIKTAGEKRRKQKETE